MIDIQLLNWVKCSPLVYSHEREQKENEREMVYASGDFYLHLLLIPLNRIVEVLMFMRFVYTDVNFFYLFELTYGIYIHTLTECTTKGLRELLTELHCLEASFFCFFSLSSTHNSVKLIHGLQLGRLKKPNQIEKAQQAILNCQIQLYLNTTMHSG